MLWEELRAVVRNVAKIRRQLLSIRGHPEEGWSSVLSLAPCHVQDILPGREQHDIQPTQGSPTQLAVKQS